MRNPKLIPQDIAARSHAIASAITGYGATALAKELGLRTTWAMYKWQKQGHVTNAYLSHFCKLTKSRPRHVCDPDIESLIKQGMNTTKSR